MQKNKSIDELQLLRGFGVIVIIIHHMNGNLFTWSTPFLKTFYSYFDGNGWLEMFFVLSGFLITRLLIKDLNHAKSLHHSLQISVIFWIRRVWRLLPVALLWIFIAISMTIFINTSGSFGSTNDALRGALAAILQVANFHLENCYHASYGCGPTFPYWSLSLEEQFYIVLPLLLIFARKWFLQIVILLTFTQFFIPFLVFDPIRLHGFLIGVLLAVWSNSSTYQIFEPKFLKNSVWGRRLLLWSLLISLSLMNPNLLGKYLNMPLSAIIGGILVFIASFDQAYLWQNKWTKRLGLWLGSRSYAMYLSHMPLIYLTREIAYRVNPNTILGPDHFWYLLVVSMILIFVLSELSYSLLEKPLRSKGIAITREMQMRQDAERKKLAATTL
jgi:peptidoglycan/LPS O-acetylase OafA/YrhL